MMRFLDWCLVLVVWLALMTACWALYLAFKANQRYEELTDPEIGLIAEVQYRVQNMEAWRLKTLAETADRAIVEAKGSHVDSGRKRY